MKKVLTILMAAACLLVMPVTNVFAEGVEGVDINTLSNNPTSGSVKLYATKASTYVVELPVSVNLSTGSGKITARVKGDVDSAYNVVIAEGEDAENKLVDKADETSTVDITVTLGNAIEGADVTSEYNTTAVSEIALSHNGLTAGTYEYLFPIVISLVEAE